MKPAASKIALQQVSRTSAPFARLKAAVEGWCARLAGPIGWLDHDAELPLPERRSLVTPAYVLALQSRAPARWTPAEASDLRRWRWG